MCNVKATIALRRRKEDYPKWGKKNAMGWRGLGDDGIIPICANDVICEIEKGI